MITMMRSQKGIVLMTAYMLFSVMSIMALAMFTRNSVFIQSAERNRKKVVAFNMAEAGFDDAFARLRNNTINSFPWDSGYVSLDTNTMEGGYRVRIVDMGNNIRQILATGYSPDMQAPTEIREVRPITAYVAASDSSAFNFGVFAKQSVQMSGNATIDSYDSRNGAYGGANVGTNGDLGTDSTSAGTVMLSGNINVNGDVTVGPSGNPNSVITSSGNILITGTKQAASEAFNPPNAPSAPNNAINYGALNISGNTILNLQAGEYKVSSISITGNAQINAMGAVKFYVEGSSASVKIAGNGFSTSSNSPPNMLIYYNGTSQVQMSGNAKFYGGLYAPNADVKNVGNGEIFGGVVSKTYQQSGNGKVHFDEALKEVGGGSSDDLTLKSWKENNVSAQNTSRATSY